MYYLAEAIYNDNIALSSDELQNSLMPAHVAHVNAAIERGMILLAGPKAAGKGGFLLIRGDDAAEIQAMLDSDPLVTSGVQHFAVTPWIIYDKAENLKDLF